ncbi:hypothetical protein [Nocardia asteroides]|uniref:hypothetical protein n=2 Tax=Nocardia asteroides TaxID=1824 RepID=UPI0034245B89
MPFRPTAPPRAGRPSGMRSDRHESRPMTSESSRPVAPPHTGSMFPPAPGPAASAAPAHRHSAAQLSDPASHRVATGHRAVAVDPGAMRTAATPPVAVDGGWRRRSLLRLLGTTAVGLPALSALAACAEDDTVHAPDPLAAQEVLARADAAAAQAAIALAPQSQAVLTVVATERTAHADALRTEIDRVIGVYGDGTTPVHRTGEITVPGPDGVPVPASTMTNAGQPLTIAQLRDQLGRSQQAAAALARTESGYRAGLLASISAACATEAGVLLA